VTAGPVVPAWDLEAAADLTNTTVDVAAVLQTLFRRAAAGQSTNIGFPGAVDIDYGPVMPLFTRLWNNVGDPATPPGGSAHTTLLERTVIDWCADLLALPADDRWGYITAGGTEGNLAALHAAHHRMPDAVVYYSRASHYSIRKIIDIIGVDSVAVATDDRGEMDYHDLAALARHHADRSAIIVANAGTTMTEAVDDIRCIHAALRPHALQLRHVHVDAALSGVPLALDGILLFEPESGIDSIAFSGHKFFGTPIPCGVVLMRDSARKQGHHVPYTATLDTTVSGSRCGQAAALLWYAIAAYGHAGHRVRVDASRDLAAYAVAQLTAIGWTAWRHPHAFTVVLRTPPAVVTRKWLLASEGDWSHTICMPGITRGQVDTFVADIAAAVKAAPTGYLTALSGLATAEGVHDRSALSGVWK
jgi:histidine decarboxylase